MTHADTPDDDRADGPEEVTQASADMCDPDHIRHAQRDIPEAAKRALAEAEERRRKAKALDLPKELGGRDGPEPVRYGDWEKDGLAIDF